MICSRPLTHCHECGDVLVHQTNRGEDESSSAFGQYVHDKVPVEMFWSDIDGAVYAKRNQMLRILEHKNRGKSLSDGQRVILELLAKAIQPLTQTGLVHPQSGVFLVESDAPFTAGRVTPVAGWQGGWRRRDVPRPAELSGQRWLDFLTCGELPPAAMNGLGELGKAS